MNARGAKLGAAKEVLEAPGAAGPPRPRVLVLTPWFPNKPGDRDGVYIYESAAAVSRLSVPVAVLVTRAWLRSKLGQWQYKALSRHFKPDAFTDFEQARLVHHLSFPGNRLPRVTSWLHDRIIGRALIAYCREVGVSLIHAHTEGEAPVAVAVGKQLGIPVIVTLHGINPAPRYFDLPFRRARFRAALTAADRIVLVGAPLESHFRDLIGSSDKFRVIPNGFKPPSGPALVPFSHGPEVRFISVSNLHEGKGIDVALQAMARLRARGFEKFNYTIVGDGKERELLQGLTFELALDDRVRFLGAQPHSQIYEVLSHADVFVLPSYREAFGVAYLEAMAAGLLAIGVEGEGPSAFIRPGETGFLVPPRDADSLADLLVEIVADPVRMRRVAAAGAAHVRATLTWDQHAHELLELFREVVSMRPAKALY